MFSIAGPVSSRVLPTFVLACVCTAATAADQGLVKPARLRCEHLVNPLGIQNETPVLSWILESPARDQRQSAYQVLVATKADLLEPGKADLWDSGKTDTDRTLDIEYAGKRIDSHTQVIWSVRVWDGAGNASPWSKPATWSTGFALGEKWVSNWIGCDSLRQVETPLSDFADAQWIAINAPQNKACGFGTDFDLPKDIEIDTAEVIVAVDTGCEVYINGVQVTNGERYRIPWSRYVEQLVGGGRNTIRCRVSKHDGPRPALLVRLRIVDSKGNSHDVVTDKSWQVTEADKVGDRKWFEATGDLGDTQDCTVLGPAGIEPWGKLGSNELMIPPAVLLRGEASLKKPIRKATLYVTGLGLFDVYINGSRVTDEFFSPGWSDYPTRAYYRAYDVTDLLSEGKNAWGAILADGWYSGYLAFGQTRDRYGKQPRFNAQILVEFEDGSTQLVSTDDSWKASTGAIQYSDFLMGEKYDARLAKDNWSSINCDTSKWKSVDVGAEMAPLVQNHPAPPVRAIEEFKAKSITEPRPGLYVIDLGQNYAGVVRLKVSGKRGQVIRLRYAERLNPDGTPYLVNLRGALATDTYICKGNGPEEWTPRFTFHGFQYVEVTGLDEAPTEETVVGVALSSDTPVAMNFECSSPMLNQLHSNVFWTQRANFIEVPTDCPQRDERLGWTGDAQVYVATACLNSDVQAFFDKWLVDLMDSQRDDGQYPSVAPLVAGLNDGGPAWADAGVVCPWTMYMAYGDKRVLERQYDSMTRFIEFCRNRSVDGALAPEQFHCWGDWLSIKADTPKPVIYTAYFAQSTRLVAKAAEVLGKKEDAKKYNELYEHIRKVFNDKYVKPDGRIEGNTQCCYALALAFDLLDEENAEKAAEYLVADIRGRDGRLSTGFVGTKDLMLVLSKIGRDDVAYELMMSDKFPSWGFSIRYGATSIWERWDGWTEENGFQTPGMNSFAHYSFGAVFQWMTENIAGIQAVEPGYKSILIAPKPGGGLTYANTDFQSPRGLISTHWKKKGDKLTVRVVIPAGTTATVRLPVGDGQSVAEGDKPVAEATGVHSSTTKDGLAEMRVGSGSYRFTVE